MYHIHQIPPFFFGRVWEYAYTAVIYKSTCTHCSIPRCRILPEQWKLWTASSRVYAYSIACAVNILCLHWEWMSRDHFTNKPSLISYTPLSPCRIPKRTFLLMWYLTLHMHLYVPCTLFNTFDLCKEKVCPAIMVQAKSRFISGTYFEYRSTF